MPRCAKTRDNGGVCLIPGFRADDSYKTALNTLRAKAATYTYTHVYMRVHVCVRVFVCVCVCVCVCVASSHVPCVHRASNYELPGVSSEPPCAYDVNAPTAPNIP